jgi:hypothetical protein
VKLNCCTRHLLLAGRGLIVSLTLGMVVFAACPKLGASSPWFAWWPGNHDCQNCQTCDGPPSVEVGGTWYWLRSPDEEKRHVTGLYNRYCIRCHGVDGRGIWDIPNVPNFTNVRWQQTRSDGQIARIVLEGRGAVMPPFRGTLTLEEAWGMARYLRTFVPGTEIYPPDLGDPKKADQKAK